MVKTCTRCKIEKPLAEFTKDKSRRDGIRYVCKVCSAERQRKYREANQEKEAEYQRKYREANPEKVAERIRKWREANRDKEAEYKREWAEANLEKVAEYTRKYREANPEKVAALSAKRRAQKLRATPAWADLKAIESVYEESARLTQCLGIEHHVDHIIPLQGKKVCGLHVHNNLQVLPAKLNIAKGNKFTTL